jgi:hypothetical protein
MMRTSLAIVLCLSSGCTLYFSDGDDEDVPQQAPPDARESVDSKVPPDARIAPLPDASVPLTCPNGCGDQVCSVTGTCVDASTVRDVTITWSYMGYPASDYTCSSAALTQIAFSFSADTYPRIGSVDCTVGSYVIENVPTSIEFVYSLVPSHYYGYCYFYIAGKQWIDPAGNVTFDLQLVDTPHDCAEP